MTAPPDGRPRLSVVTVVLNDLHGLIATCDSVAEQAQPTEHVVVDGASQDGAQGWLRAWAAAAPGRHYISEPDDGVYDAMNKGTQLSHGDLLLYLNAGDTLHAPSTLGAALAHQEAHDWRWGFGRIHRVDDGRVVGHYGDQPYDFWAHLYGASWIPHQAAFIRRDDVLRTGGYEDRFGVAADQHLLLKVASRATPAQIPVVVCDFQEGGLHTTLRGWRRERVWRHVRNDIRARHGVQVPAVRRARGELVACRRGARGWAAAHLKEIHRHVKNHA